MSYLIGVTKEGNAMLRAECTKLCPELKLLTGDEIRCIALAYDYWSIFRNFPEDEMKRRALGKVFGIERESFFSEPKIKKAVAFYRSLQYDERREQLKVYKKKLQKVTQDIDSEDSNSELASLMKTASLIRKEIVILEAEISQEEEIENNEAESGIKISLIEKLQSNKDKWDMVTKKK